MLLSNLAGKEIINLRDGAKLGQIQDADLDIGTGGGIEAIILPLRTGFSGFWGGKGEKEALVIPWKNIKKIGSEVIIVDLQREDFPEKTDRSSKFV